MGMSASKLDRRISILRSELIDDGFGNVQGEFVSIGSIWAHRSDIKDGEKVLSGSATSDLQNRFTVRNSEFSRAITAADRIGHAGLEFNITGIKESADGRLQFLELTAIARNDG
jgi:head-tail adaptor